jgi:hypothetical protein
LNGNGLKQTELADFVFDCGGYQHQALSRTPYGGHRAACRPVVLLSKFEETLIIDGRRYELSANEYPGVIHPRGFEYQTDVRLDPYPKFN